jgi:hypothetical protein
MRVSYPAGPKSALTASCRGFSGIENPGPPVRDALPMGEGDLPVFEGNFVHPGVIVVLIFVSVHLEGYVDFVHA